MRYMIREKFFRLGEDSTIFEVDGKVLSLHDRLIVRDLALHPDGKLPLQPPAWYPKPQATFSEVLATVRRHLWGGLTFQTSASHPDVCLVPRTDLTRLLQAACS